MKRFMAPLVLLFSALAVSGQTTTGLGGLYTFGSVASTGQLGAVIDSMSYTASPTRFTLDWSLSTAPTACTLQGEGSSDGVHWYSLTGPLDCTTANMVHVVDKPVAYFRINVLTYTGAAGAVTVRYTRGL